jgi:hypothetical protein
MTGREKVEAAFSPKGTPEIPAVICYEDIYHRDQWQNLTKLPWWYRVSPIAEHQIARRRDLAEKLGKDWFIIPAAEPKEVREAISIEVRGDDVIQVNKRTGEEKRLGKQRVGGWNESGGLQSVEPEKMAESEAAVDEKILLPAPFDAKTFKAQDRDVIARELLKEFGKKLWPFNHVSAPLWNTYSLWGFEGMMTMTAVNTGLVRYACDRYLQRNITVIKEFAACGCAGVWIEECLMDMISVPMYVELAVPYLKATVKAIRENGMKSIYYYCGDPNGRLEEILSVGADAVAFEESKKGFVIDIEDIAARIKGRCTLLGNFDAMELLERGDKKAIRAEVKRQIAAGRKNGSRFILSTGSPVTPGTPPEKVRLFTGLVHDLGGK